MALADFLRSWQRAVPTPPSSPSPQPNQSSAPVPYSNQKVGDYSAVLGRTLTAEDLQYPQGQVPTQQQLDQMIAANPTREAMIRAAYSPEAIAQSNQQMNAYNQKLESLRQQFSSGQLTSEQYAQALRGMSTAPTVVPTDRPSQPAAGSLDVYNPGPYIAQLLRSQLPGYVFGTKVPRPNQITLSEFLRLNPTQQQVLASYVSAIGIPPEDFLQEMQRYWLKGTPTQQVNWTS